MSAHNEERERDDRRHYPMPIYALTALRRVLLSTTASDAVAVGAGLIDLSKQSVLLPANPSAA